MNMFLLIYQGLWRLAPFWIRRYLRRRAGKNPAYLEHWDERFGKMQNHASKGVLWIHAVSVGETRAAAPIIRALQKRHPNLPLLITQMTPTGRATAEQLFPQVQCRYLPYDRKDYVEQFLDDHQPIAGILMETEIWINLLDACQKRHIPMILANARLSEKSATGYERFRGLFQVAFASFVGVLTQTQDDAQRFQKLGAKNVFVMGNTKYDIQPDGASQILANEFRQKVGNRPVFVCASTREKDGIDEAKLILEAWQKIHSENILLVLIPRHPERFQAAFDMAENLGFRVQKRSDNQKVDLQTQVWIGDSMGELFAYYLIANVAFVGGSLVDTGCQNIIEPIACGVSVIFGWSTYNFASATEEALKAGVARQVNDADECVATALSLLHQENETQRLSAQKMISQHQGASERIADYVSGCLKMLK